jgi:DNA-binding Lrp family transcriptional regulator
MPRLAPGELEKVREALAVDGRASATQVAQAAGITPRKAREVVAAMTATDRYTVRVDVARARTPWPVSVWYFLQVPADKVSRVGPVLSRIDEARLVVTATGEYNVIMAAWLRSLREVNKLEAVLEERLSGVRIVDRSVVLRSLKHLGHLLDEHGDATGTDGAHALTVGSCRSVSVAAVFLQPGACVGEVTYFRAIPRCGVGPPCGLPGETQ